MKGGLFEKEFYSEIYKQKGHPCQDDFITFAKIIGESDIQTQKMMKDFLTSQPLVYDLTERSFLSEKLKQMYIRSYEERLKRLNRSSIEK